jgi:hypothetical protein
MNSWTEMIYRPTLPLSWHKLTYFSLCSLHKVTTVVCLLLENRPRGVFSALMSRSKNGTFKNTPRGLFTRKLDRVNCISSDISTIEQPSDMVCDMFCTQWSGILAPKAMAKENRPYLWTNTCVTHGFSCDVRVLPQLFQLYDVDFFNTDDVQGGCKVPDDFIFE